MESDESALLEAEYERWDDELYGGPPTFSPRVLRARLEQIAGDERIARSIFVAARDYWLRHPNVIQAIARMDEGYTVHWS